MVFKKPYAFFIKYFRHINFVLSMLFIYFVYRLNLIREVMSGIYRGNITNYSTLNSEYVGFRMYFLLVLILIVLSAIILLLKRKNKPLNDYLYAALYSFICFGYLLFISNIFFTLDETIVEQTDLLLYSDISLLIIIPFFYFIVKFFLIVIGFSLNKFNFAKDIIELKQDEKDNEEVEVVFNKNSYKYKRGIRKKIRELKYYFLENKFIITIIVIVVVTILFLTAFSFNVFDTNKYSVGQSFNAGGFNYKIIDVYETRFDLNRNLIKEDSKFIIVKAIVMNSSVSSNIDFKRIRLLYDNKYSYASSYFNKYFIDLGVPYDGRVLKNGESNSFAFVFKVPSEYNSSKYKLKFYDRISIENEEAIGSYKEVKVNATKLDKKIDEKIMALNENVVFNDRKYGSSNLTLSSYLIQNTYTYKTENKTSVIRDKDINKTMLIVDYKLQLDKDNVLSEYFVDDVNFFDNFLSLSYTYNGIEKTYNKLSVLGCVNGKVMLSVPYDVKESSNLKLNINFRDIKIVYKLK